MNKEQAYNRNFDEHVERTVTQAFLALNDDVGFGDITTKALVKEENVDEAVIIAKASGILCGLQEAKAILEDGGLDFKSEKREGDALKKGDIIATIRGNIHEILKRERTALDYLQVMSGIATATHKLVKQYPGKVASLRKTHPGLVYSEKRAVKVGGGFSHRLGLYDGFLIKDNHLASIVREVFGEGKVTEDMKVESVKLALQRAKEYRSINRMDKCFIEIEVESLPQALAAAKFHKQVGVPDMILLDNMTQQDVAKCVKAIKKALEKESS